VLLGVAKLPWSGKLGIELDADVIIVSLFASHTEMNI
jgi:hypothetical protein